MKSPTPAQVVQLRESVQADQDIGMTKAREYCAELVYSKLRAWQRWETGERDMHPALWELVRIKAGV